MKTREVKQKIRKKATTGRDGETANVLFHKNVLLYVNSKKAFLIQVRLSVNVQKFQFALVSMDPPVHRQHPDGCPEAAIVVVKVTKISISLHVLHFNLILNIMSRQTLDILGQYRQGQGDQQAQAMNITFKAHNLIFLQQSFCLRADFHVSKHQEIESKSRIICPVGELNQYEAKLQ